MHTHTFTPFNNRYHVIYYMNSYILYIFFFPPNPSYAAETQPLLSLHTLLTSPPHPHPHPSPSRWMTQPSPPLRWTVTGRCFTCEVWVHGSQTDTYIYVYICGDIFEVFKSSGCFSCQTWRSLLSTSVGSDWPRSRIRMFCPPWWRYGTVVLLETDWRGTVLEGSVWCSVTDHISLRHHRDPGGGGCEWGLGEGSPGGTEQVSGTGTGTFVKWSAEKAGFFCKYFSVKT